MDVPVTELRAHLSEWLAKVKGGEEVNVTERGIPVARLAPLDSSELAIGRDHVVMAVFDHRLHQAAQAEGLATVPATL